MNNINRDLSIAEQTSPELDVINGDEMALSEHIEEFSQRLIFCILALITATLTCFADIRQIVKVFQLKVHFSRYLSYCIRL